MRQAAGASLSSLFSPTDFAQIAGWTDDDHAAAFSAFRLSALHARENPYRTGSLGIAAEALEPACAHARSLRGPDRKTAREFFERHFVACRIDAGQSGFVTGYYEPVVRASPEREGRYVVPLYRRPHDLVDIGEDDRPQGLDPYHAFARKTPEGLVDYFDRAAIEQGALAGRNLELAWLESRVDAFFVHVQGSARLEMTDGTEKRITYAAKSGHRFTGIGGILVATGEIAPNDISMQAIRAWFAANPGRIDEILWQNRSFIFFREAPVDDPALGPVAAAKVPLTPGRSIAVDRLLHTFSTPFFIEAPGVRGFGAGPLRRLMIAQDTGSAITGAARADLFAGTGRKAGEIAGVIKNDAVFYTLVPRSLILRSTPAKQAHDDATPR